MDRFSLTEVDKASDGTLLAMVGLVGHEEEGKNARKRAQWKPEPTRLNIQKNVRRGKHQHLSR